MEDLRGYRDGIKYDESARDGDEDVKEGKRRVSKYL